MQDELLPSAHQLLALLSASPLPKLLLSPHLDVRWANPAWQRLTGRSGTACSRRELMYPAEVLRLEALFARLLEGSLKSFRSEAHWQSADGSWLRLETSVSGLYDDQGRLNGALEELQDAQPLRQLQTQAQQLGERLARLEALAHLGFWQAAVPAGEMLWSQGCYRMLGRSPETCPPALPRHWNWYMPMMSKRFVRF